MKKIVLLFISFIIVLLFSSSAFCVAAWDGSTDDSMLLSVEKAAFDYFWNNSNSGNGNFTVAEEQANFSGVNRPYSSAYSVSAAGMGLVAICAGHKNGWISLAQAKTRIDAILTAHYNAPDISTAALTAGLVQHNGFFYHYTNRDGSGSRETSNTELSTIDTSWFIAGALFAGQYIKDNGGGSVEWDYADAIYKRIDWNWMRNGGNYLKWAWTPENGFFGQGNISGYSEGIICYILAMGSPTHPLSDINGWNTLTCQTISYKGLSYIYDGGHNPLFMHQYPSLFIDFAGEKTTTNASFALNTYNATIHQHRYAYDNRSTYSTYGESFGLSATDVPGVGSDGSDGLWGLGYTDYGTFNSSGVVCLSAMVASINELPVTVKKNIRYLHDTYTTDIWGIYGFPDSYKKDASHSSPPSTYKSWGWVDGKIISHQQGSALAAIENYRTGLIKNTFTNKISYIQTGLTALVFTKDTVAPEKISNIGKNLYLSPTKESARLGLSWLAPGNNYDTGVISSGIYEIRFTTNSADTWESAPPNYLNYNIIWSTNTNPSDPQSFLLTNLVADTTYYAWLRIADDCFNWSPISDTITFRAGIVGLSQNYVYNTNPTNSSVSIIFNGDCFDSGTTVKLTKSGEADILPLSTSVQSSTAIIATFNLFSQTTGYWTPIANLGGSSVMVSTFTNGFSIKPMAITSISSSTCFNTSILGPINIIGEGFVSGVSVKLEREGFSDILGTDVVLNSSTSISAVFDVVGKSAGNWTISVTTGSFTAKKADALNINPNSISAYLNQNQDFSLAIVTSWGSSEIFIPAGTFSQSVSVVLSSATINKEERDGQRIMPIGVGISAEGFQPNGNITITLNYTDADVVGYDETKLVLARFDPKANRWLELPSTVYPELNKIVATTNHLSTFALIQLLSLNSLTNAFAYPVPFDPIKQSAGLTFDKLTKDAEIKIYAINGAFVRQVKYLSQDGKANWDGRDYSGEYVASGVYIALIKNNNEKKIIKIAVEK